MPNVPPPALTLPALEFPFPALAAAAGRAAPGGDRELAMACLLVARLITGMMGPEPLAPAVRRARAEGARAWLVSHPMSVRLRTALERALDATTGERMGVAKPLRALLEMTAARLDGEAHAELARLLNQVEGIPSVAPPAGRAS